MGFGTGRNGGGLVATDAFAAPLNNANLDPFQGFDADVWVLDQTTGAYILVGRFVSIQITVRNTTEPYMEMNQRIPRYLDGEIQIGWVLERGMTDVRILQQTFGFDKLSRQMRLNRQNRLQISFSVNAPDLQMAGDMGGKNAAAFYQKGSSINGDGNTSTDLGSYNGAFQNSFIAPNDNTSVTTNFAEKPIDNITKYTGITAASFQKRDSIGRLRLTMAKVDSLTIGATAGRSVIANRWEGVAEGIEWVDDSPADPGTWLASAFAGDAIANAAAAEFNTQPFPWDPYSGKDASGSIDPKTSAEFTTGTPYIY